MRSNRMRVLVTGVAALAVGIYAENTFSKEKEPSRSDPVAVLHDVERETSVAAGGAGWFCGNPNDYYRDYTVDLVQLLAFLIETQPNAFDGLNLSEDGPSRRKFLARLQAEVSALTEAVAKTVGRPAACVHVAYEPAAAGRISFGGKLVQ